MPGSDVQVMLDANDPKAPVGPLFVVDSVQAFHSARAESLTVVERRLGRSPASVDGDPTRSRSGATFYVMDQSTDSAAE